MEALAATPAERLRELAARLDDERVRLEEGQDLRAVFTCAYALLTLHLEKSLAATGYDQPERVAELAEGFADRYFAALEAPRDELPAGWEPVFTFLSCRRCSPLDALVLSMAAHIVWDLPQVLAERRASSACLGLGDFQRMNGPLVAAIDEIQRAVGRRYDPLLSWLDAFVGREDEYLTGHALRLARVCAWYNSLRLMDRPLMEDGRRSILAATKRIVADVRRPRSFWLRAAVGALRLTSALVRRWPRQTRPLPG